MHNREKGKAAARMAIILSMVIWGTGVVVTKIAVEETAPVLMATLRFGIAAAVFVPYSMKKSGLKPLLCAPLALSSFIGITLYYLLFNYGILYTSASTAGLLQGILPLYTLLLAWLFLKEKITIPKVAGVVCSFIGVALLVLFYDDRAGGSAPLLGNILIISSDLCFTIYLLTGKVILRRLPRHIVTAGNMFYGFIFLVPFALFEFYRCGYEPVSLKCWLLIAYLGIVSGGIATSTWNYGLPHLPSTEAGLLANLCPIIAVLTAVCVLGEPFSPALVAGGILILGGVYLASRQAGEPAAAPSDGQSSF